MVNKISFLIAMLILFSNCQKGPHEKYDLLITNATILNVHNGEVSSGMMIGISGDVIRMVEKMKNLKKYNSSNKFDAENKFVMPGLWDMHVHFRGGDSLINENKNLLPLFLSYGITSVRDAGGDMTLSVMNWKDEINDGTLVGPNIFTSGPKLDGPKPAWVGSLVVETNEDIIKAMDSLESLGVDYVKMYDGSLSKEAFYGIVKEASKRNLKTTGHMPLAANILEAAQLGLDGSEHVFYALKSCSILPDSIFQVNNGRGVLGAIAENYEPNKAREVFEELGNNDFYITPTLEVMNVLSDVAEKDHSQDSLLSFIGNGIISTYQGRVESAKKAAARGGKNIYMDMLALSSKYIPAMDESGIKIIAGSDSGAFNSYCYPGASLINELSLMVKSGLSPQQALKTSVINGPLFFDLEDFYGGIEIGKMSDIIVLEENPFEDIRNLNTVSKVIKNGILYEAGEFRSTLKALKLKNLE